MKSDLLKVQSKVGGRYSLWDDPWKKCSIKITRITMAKDFCCSKLDRNFPPKRFARIDTFRNLDVPRS